MTPSGIAPLPPTRGWKTQLADQAPLVLVVISVWLGWQILLQPIKERAPPALGLRLAPGSAQLLARAAEDELTANRTDNAAALADEVLLKTPFSVRGLRVLGLAKARQGHKAQADEMLTLAGNWSLRDDPTHGWLVEYRLSRGDYSSAYAHADTLARRRLDRQPQIFRLFSAAAEQDPRSVPALTALLARNPPWRANYINTLYRSVAGHRVAATLAITLAKSHAPFSRDELGVLYAQLLSRGWMGAIAQVRAAVGGGSAQSLTNGSFDPPAAPLPYEWALFGAAGVSAEILPDDLRSENALRVQYESFSDKKIAEQFLQLGPGSYRLSTQLFVESGEISGRLVWTISCFETAESPLTLPEPAGPVVRRWRSQSVAFVIPATGCSGQWLRLMPLPGDDRAPVTVWYDRFSITPAS